MNKWLKLLAILLMPIGFIIAIASTIALEYVMKIVFTLMSVWLLFYLPYRLIQTGVQFVTKKHKHSQEYAKNHITEQPRPKKLSN